MPETTGGAHGIDLNTATEEQLERIVGLGLERARRIIQSRPFRTWEDLKRVQGLHEKLIEDLKKAGATIGRKVA